MYTVVISEHRGRRAGFSLVELLVVIAIISILASLTMPSVSSSLNRARATACSSNLRQNGTAIILYSSDHDGDPPETGAGSYQPWVPLIYWNRNRAENDGYQSLGLLVHEQFLGSHETLYCPGQRGGKYSIDGYPAWPESAAGGNWTYGSYDMFFYWNASRGFHHPPLMEYGEQPLCNDSITTIEPDASLAHQDRWNVLYADGRVKLYRNGSKADQPGPLAGIDMVSVIQEMQVNDSWPYAGYLRNRLESD
jgi:prepilin-type N-terminal cleavage/methylation domain-containing protein/prepilin-type processing-associated H-X9-DG protein